MDIFAGEKDELRGDRLGDRSIRIRKAHHKGIKKLEQGAYEITATAPKSFWGKLSNNFHIALFGRPIRSDREIHERVTKVKGLAVFASDCISSSAYATEEVMRVLILGGAGVLLLNIPISTAVLILLAIVVTSYQQTIMAYPKGGGSYIVAKENLGVIPGLIAASAVLIDYVLTVAVSISSGIYALTSAFPSFYDDRIWLCIVAITIIAWGNLRGIRESATIFTIPVYIYIFSMIGVLGYGIIKYFVTGFPPHISPYAQHYEGISHALGFFLILRAFSSGACGLTGVEAVADGVPAFKPPEPKNARITLIWMAVLFGAIFFSISFLSTKLGIMPDPHETDNVISQVVKMIVGKNWSYYLIQFSTMFILVLAANTSFADFPRLAYFLARDKFLPSHFGFRGDRLAFNNGIVALSVLAACLVIIFKASTTHLIPLYTIGVFVAFTSSQAGMVFHWWRTKESGWRWKMPLNAFGAAITFVVLIVVGVTKFSHGAWAVLILIPVLVGIFLSIYRHHQKVIKHIVAEPEKIEENLDQMVAQITNYILIPISDATIPTLQVVAYAKSLIGAGRANVMIQAVHVTDNLQEGKDLQQKWSRFNTGIPLVLIESPYRRLVRPLVRYIEALEKAHHKKNIIITVLLPEVISQKWWEYFYHKNTVLLLKGALLFKPKVVVASFPYHIKV